MRYLELLRDLFDTFIKRRQSWEPVFAKEREERKRKREERDIIDVEPEVLNTEKR